MKRTSQSFGIVALIILGTSCGPPPSTPTQTGLVAPPSAPVQQEQFVQLGADIRLDRHKSQVMIRAQVAARNGWLEQLVCKAGTREHESLLAVEAAPKMIHAALLAAGFSPGAPGSWVEMPPDAAGKPVIRFQPPTGAQVELLVRWEDGGRTNERALCDWVRSVPDAAQQGDTVTFPCDRFVFAGSHVRPNPRSLGPGEHYVADYTGSIVGLVTFGDEVIAFEEVIPDRVDIAPAIWEAWTERIPPEGTPVELVVRRRR